MLLASIEDVSLGLGVEDPPDALHYALLQSATARDATLQPGAEGDGDGIIQSFGPHRRYVIYYRMHFHLLNPIVPTL